MCVLKTLPFALKVLKTALEKHLGNALWDNNDTILLSTLGADMSLS